MSKFNFEEIINEISEIEISKSQVYIQTDEQGNIVRCEGGYSIANISNIDEWIWIDEGNGDKYNLCQSNYFDGGLYTLDGIPRYKWNGQEVIARTEAEIEADRAALPKQPVLPTYEERLSAMESAMLAMAMALGEE